MNIESIKQCIENIEKELVELKAYVNEIEVKKTPNQLRAEVIEKAKSFVEIKSSYLKDSTECDGGSDAKRRENPNYCTFVTKCIFIVNAEKRTVVAILKYLNNSIIKKSITKCNPSDVFNEHIGKAIALGRALGLNVSEFENAVQPNEVVVGHRIRRVYLGSNRSYERTVKAFEYNKVFYTKYNSWDVKKSVIESSTIINDTNAIYGGFE